MFPLVINDMLLALTPSRCRRTVTVRNAWLYPWPPNLHVANGIIIVFDRFRGLEGEHNTPDEGSKQRLDVYHTVVTRHGGAQNRVFAIETTSSCVMGPSY